jgi:hypothetical protein
MRKFVSVGALVAAGCASQPVQEAAPARDPAIARAQFERFKGLAGTWKPTPESAMKADLTYRVIGGGNTVEERLYAGTPAEMITMYHLDGGDLVLTHYCAMGNQPRMRALPSSDTSHVEFVFVGLGSGDPAKDAHMHDAKFWFGDDGRLRSEWSSWENGKPGEFVARIEMMRAP